MIEIQLGFETKSKAIYIRLADSTYLLVEVFLSDVIHVEVSVKCIKHECAKHLTYERIS